MTWGERERERERLAERQGWQRDRDGRETGMGREKKRGRQAHRHRHTQTDTDTDTHTHTYTHTHTHTHTQTHTQTHGWQYFSNHPVVCCCKLTASLVFFLQVCLGEFRKVYLHILFGLNMSVAVKYLDFVSDDIGLTILAQREKHRPSRPDSKQHHAWRKRQSHHQ